MRLFFHIIFLLLLTSQAIAQGSCPDNIGFEQGGFDNWKCYGGNIASTGTINVNLTGPLLNRHTMETNTVPPVMDPYGNFPVNCPNGSNYSIKLGNELSGAQAERVTYTFTVPPGKDDYSIIYNYAIVFQNPSHLPDEQPKFTSRVYDETENQYLGCGSFEFVASSGLPGFQLSGSGQNVYYKPWSPVTVKLMNCAGKTITLEFTVNDCSKGGHFGYAYLDVNENCSSPISGNVYCNGATSITLTAPFGFKEYQWYPADFSTLLGTKNTLTLNPIPPVGKKFALIIVPYPGVGCLDTLYTTIEKSNDAFDFHLLDTVKGCIGYPVDLTSRTLTQGSSSPLTFTYYMDSMGLDYLPSPNYVTTEGKYFIKASNMVGCTEIKPINLIFADITVIINDPPDICFPNTANITTPAITAGSDPGLAFTYWKDNAASFPLTNPTSISEAGVYYIQAKNASCAKTFGVNVRIWKADDFVTNPISACASVDITSPSVTAGSRPVFTFSPWTDASGTVPLSNPTRVLASGTYYIKAVTNAGCAFIKPVTATVHDLPSFTVQTPAAVVAPQTIDITNVVNSTQPYRFSFWLNDSATRALTNPAVIKRSGTFYIKAETTEGCAAVLPVTVTINIPPKPVIRYPNTFSPNNDGINDGFRIDVTGDITLKNFKIYNRWGQVVFETKDYLQYWYGDNKGKPLPVGTYYWVIEFDNNYDQEFYRRSGSITLIR